MGPINHADQHLSLGLAPLGGRIGATPVIGGAYSFATIVYIVAAVAINRVAMLFASRSGFQRMDRMIFDQNASENLLPTLIFHAYNASSFGLYALYEQNRTVVTPRGERGRAIDIIHAGVAR